MKSFTWKIVICVVPLLLGILVVSNALWKYKKGEGGFNLGVDLVGGTILVYEVDESRWPDGQMPADYDINKLTAKLKQRIDPADLYNITIRPLSKTRVEIILPTGGIHYAQHQQEVWDQLIKEVKEKWPPRKGHEADYDVGLDQRDRLIEAVAKEQNAKAQQEAPAPVEGGAQAAAPPKTFNPEELAKLIDSRLSPKGEKRKSMTGEQVQAVKDLISRVGSLKFVILANTDDDPEAIRIAQDYFDKMTPAKEQLLETEAVSHRPPPRPEPPDGQAFRIKLGDKELRVNYRWIELGPNERHYYGLANDQTSSTFWKQMEDARRTNKAVTNSSRQGGQYHTHLFFSRKVKNVAQLPPDQRTKEYEYFILCRDPAISPEGKSLAVTGEDLITAGKTDDSESGGLAVSFTFNSKGAALLGELTTDNKNREMAIVLDDLIQSAPNIKEPITGGQGRITGNYTPEEVDRMVNILRSGALPATLKPQPVSENTMGATLGEDTIYWGTVSVLVAFAAILLFMLVYYRFAGIVACIALLANLILTVAVMVLINATFTLPGLAGLVLMLGMAVDANVLIYERLREERERGASLALAIRNGYDRAFPTIIDTHLSSIFTAIVLYVVGNDQLKGFGITLTLGLIISLFTSLYVTRLMFDYWLSKGWLHKLSMMRLIPHTNINFMAIRYYWFTATIILTILGASIFIFRLNKGGLNIDFMGGTAYTGLLKKEGDKQGLTITELRKALDAEAPENKDKLAIEKVEFKDDKGNYTITYVNPGPTGEKTHVVFVDKEKRPDGTIAPVSLDEVKKRATDLPDLSIVQIFASDYSQGDRSRLFTVRTQEKAATLVQAAIDRLLGDKLQKIEMVGWFKITDKTLADLKADHVPEDVTAKLDPMKDKDFPTRDALTAQLGEVLNKAELEEYSDRVLKKAQLPPFAVADDGRSAEMTFNDFASPAQVNMLLEKWFNDPTFSPLDKPGLKAFANQFQLVGEGKDKVGRYLKMKLTLAGSGKITKDQLTEVLEKVRGDLATSPQPERLENFDAQLAADTQFRALYAILASWGAILLYLWFRFGSWTFGMAAVLCLIHDLFFTLGFIGIAHYIHQWWPNNYLGIQDFKIDLNSVAALLTLIGYSVSDTIVVFDRIREVRGKNPELTPKMINDSVNQTLSRTLLTALSVWLVVLVLYAMGGEGVHLFAFVMVIGVIVGTYSSIYIASPLLLIFGEGKPTGAAQRQAVAQG